MARCYQNAVQSVNLPAGQGAVRLHSAPILAVNSKSGSTRFHSASRSESASARSLAPPNSRSSWGWMSTRPPAHSRRGQNEEHDTTEQGGVSQIQTKQHKRPKTPASTFLVRPRWRTEAATSLLILKTRLFQRVCRQARRTMALVRRGTA